MQALQPIILSGGSGTRLWPMSRRLYPKQFMDLQGSTLFGQAAVRAAALPGSLAPLVICNEEQRFLAAAILQQEAKAGGRDKLAEAHILLEPTGRNTAPAIALGALAAREMRPEGETDPLLLVLSSDHVISPQEAFAKAVHLAAAGADSGRLVVFGVQPTHPETGFGYIKQGEQLFQDVFAVERFVEKPDSRTANAMLDEGGYVWNSGMFMFRASVFLDELSRYAPKVHEACLAIWQSRRADLDFMRFSPEVFAACPSVSIDYAVMEQTQKACVTPLSTAWNDMGSWEAFYGSSDRDENGNARTGDVIELESRNCYLHSSHRLVAAIGLDGISVVETADAVLVMPRERSQDVKLLLEELKKRERPETDTHVRVYRPWGSYETLELGERFQVKRIIVRPGGVLSLQMHHHRAEHWVVVRGTAKITVGDKELVLKEDESTYIPLGIRHRLENPGCIPLEIIEIQTGSYLGEDDIVRFEDTYGRVE
ncbi:MAG: mannose-1-phosphate guanylyltransferase/mannose-6-phosphate isomerase [Treponema sp.]|jgi:mannose-1-phosphate guanylyltransferase/mannose-6-phosphate isomerase|nr:mannose-1-phosphate guanylyltransferase/mannose-6-phosphate isomerase [Treponema sp.]